jgi:hypothetical protein
VGQDLSESQLARQAPLLRPDNLTVDATIFPASIRPISSLSLKIRKPIRPHLAYLAELCSRRGEGDFEIVARRYNFRQFYGYKPQLNHTQI